MERLSYQLITHMRKQAIVASISWGRTQLGLPWFLMHALVRGIRLARDVDLLHAGDPLVAPVVYILAKIYRIPAIMNVHGLDITFNFPGYQYFVSNLMKRFDLIICISHTVRRKVLSRGLDPGRCCVIHPGVDIPDQLPDRYLARKHLEARIGRSLNNSQVWLTVGRLIPRKGITWFCEVVLPQLRDAGKFVYLIAGTGPEMPHLRSIVRRLGLDDYVYLLGLVDDSALKWLYTGADLFIMPNIPQPHHPEGFGLVAIEAAAHSLPVIAARLDGIQEAVIDRESGYLLPPQDTKTWVSFLRLCLDNPFVLDEIRARAREAVRSRFAWDKIIEQYLNVFYEVLDKKKKL
ncbi:glycosyltransferase family 4 protein [Thermoflexus sp.]|uniref:glycosyltransferase family 4 protein n=1 Tax=Thermoflexus sp. TaxID=1969742 RepID=UPI002ADE4F10|nr:glycosyltransferase family 4 protein [Thermoflexus sp.]